MHALVLLLDSAITYTPARHEVVAEVENAGPEIVFRVKQIAGKGLTESKIRQIGAAGQGRKGTREDATGGFTLALCREIVETNRGRFWIEPGTPSGATFHVALPAIQYEPRSAAYTAAQAAQRRA